MIKIKSPKTLLLERVKNDVTRAKAVSERKKSIRKFDFQLCCVNNCKTKKSVRRRKKTKSTAK